MWLSIHTQSVSQTQHCTQAKHVLEPHSVTFRTQTVLHASLAIYSAAIEVMAKVYLIPVHVDGVALLRVSQVSPCTP